MGGDDLSRRLWCTRPSGTACTAAVDNGLLRYKEQERVMKMFEDHLHLPVTCIDDSERLLGKLKGVTDPEKKQVHRAQFIEVFKEYKQTSRKRRG